MASSKHGHVTVIYGFLSTSVNSITNKLGRMIDRHSLILPGRNNGVIKARSRDLRF